MGQVKTVEITETSQYGTVSGIEPWPVLTDEEVRDELLHQLNTFSDDEIIGGITVAVSYVDSKTGDAVYRTGLHTDGIDSLGEAIQSIKSGEFDCLGQCGIQIAVRVLEEVTNG